MNTQATQNYALPMLLLSGAFLLLTVIQTQQIMIDRGSLKRAYASQEEGVKQSKLIQDKLDSIATGTLELSEKGNKNAKAIIDGLKARGVTVNPKKAEAAPAGTDAPAPAAEAPPADAKEKE